MSEAEMRALAKRASIPADALERHPSDLKEDKPGKFSAAALCGNSVEYTHVSHRRVWNNEELLLFNQVHYYERMPAKQVISQVRALHSGCATYVPRGATKPTSVLPELRLPRPRAGVDGSFAYCEEARSPRHAFLCYAYFSRGHLLSVIFAVSLTLHGAQETVRVVAPLAELSLIHA